MSNPLPRISIITVCFNAASTIEQTIQSVIDQDYPAKEFIIVDGKSKDKTMEIIERYKHDIDVIVSEKDSGIPDALNKGIARATGDWLYFLSSDDVFYDRRVLYNVFSGAPDADMLYGDVIMKTTGNRYDGKFDLRKLLLRNICHQAQFYRRELFDRIGAYNIAYKLLSDYDHTLRIFADKTLRIVHIDIVIALFNDTGRTAYQIDHAFWKDRKQNFLERFHGQLPDNELVRAYELYFYQNFKAGDIFKGTRVLLELVYYTRNMKYVNAAVKNIYYRIRQHA